MIDFLWLYREILHRKFYYTLIIINLSLGLIGYFTIESFRYSIESYGKSQRKNILGADLSVSARRPLSPQEEEAVGKAQTQAKRTTEVYSFFAMTVYKDRSKLSLAKVIGDGFPLYGDLKLEKGSRALSEAKNEPYLWLEPELAAFLGATVGEKIKIGNLWFTMAGVVLKDSTAAFRFGGIAQRAYFHSKWLEQTGLIQFGSTFTRTRLFQLNSDEEAKSLAKILSDSIQDLAIQVETADEVAQESLRPLQYLIDFLGLVGIVALLLSVLSSSYLLRVFINEQITSIALLNCLGISSFKILRIFLIRSVLIGLLCVLFAGFGASLLGPALGAQFKSAGIIDWDIHFYWPTLLLGLAVTLIISQLFWLPYFLKVMGVPGYALLREGVEHVANSWRRAILYLPGFLVLWLLSVWTAHSWQRGSLFVAVLLVASFFILLLGRIFIWLLSYVR